MPQLVRPSTGTVRSEVVLKGKVRAIERKSQQAGPETSLNTQSNYQRQPPIINQRAITSQAELTPSRHMTKYAEQSSVEIATSKHDEDLEIIKISSTS